MKVILNTFGVMVDKEFLKKIQGMTEFEWRTNESIIALIEKRQNEIIYLCKLKENDEITVSQQFRLDKLTEQYNDWLHFRIQEVDTSKKWAISEYDSATYIQYFDVVDEQLNFYGFI